MENKKVSEKYLAFRLGNEMYAVDANSVIAIDRIKKVTRIPMAPPFVKGVVELRGMMVPLVDLRMRFSLPEQEATRETCVMFVSGKHSSVGVIVDAVLESKTFISDQISSPPNLSQKENPFVVGLHSSSGGEVSIIVDLTLVIGLEEQNSEISA